jgi:hypothetical protein
MQVEVDLSQFNCGTVHTWFNVFEAIFWVAMGVLLIVRSTRISQGLRGVGLIAGLTFLAFAVTDLVEVRTGAWYRPWWLFVSKAVCVVLLAACYDAYRRRARLNGQCPRMGGGTGDGV